MNHRVHDRLRIRCRMVESRNPTRERGGCTVELHKTKSPRETATGINTAKTSSEVHASIRRRDRIHAAVHPHLQWCDRSSDQIEGGDVSARLCGRDREKTADQDVASVG